MKRIESRDNPLYRELLQVAQSARERRKLGAALIEGIHLCQAFLDRFGPPREAVIAQDAVDHPEVRAIIARLQRAPALLAPSLFRALSEVASGVGVAFLVGTPAPELPPLIDHDAVYLDRLQDPGNVGTILRTCAAVGIARVITAPGSAMCWAPKVMRAAMGAHFHLDIHESVVWSELLPRVRVQLRATVARDATLLYDADLRSPGLWLMGQEGEGLSAQILAADVLRIGIPQSAAVESLNVGVAAAVCLYEQLRQRGITKA